MIKTDLETEVILNEYQIFSVTDPSKLLSEFLNGLVIQFDEEYTYGS